MRGVFLRRKRCPPPLVPHSFFCFAFVEQQQTTPSTPIFTCVLSGRTSFKKPSPMASRRAFVSCSVLYPLWKRIVARKRRKRSAFRTSFSTRSSRAKLFSPPSFADLTPNIFFCFCFPSSTKNPTGASRPQTSASGRWRDRRTTATSAAAARVARALAASSARSSAAEVAAAAAEGARASERENRFFFPLSFSLSLFFFAEHLNPTVGGRSQEIKRLYSTAQHSRVGWGWHSPPF